MKNKSTIRNIPYLTIILLTLHTASFLKKHDYEPGELS